MVHLSEILFSVLFDYAVKRKRFHKCEYILESGWSDVILHQDSSSFKFTEHCISLYWYPHTDTHFVSHTHARTVMPDMLFDLDWVSHPMSTLKEYDKMIKWSIHDPGAHHQSTPLPSLESQHTFLTSGAVKFALERRRERKGTVNWSYKRSVWWLLCAHRVPWGKGRENICWGVVTQGYTTGYTVIQAWHASFTHTLYHKCIMTGQEQKRGTKAQWKSDGGVFQTGKSDWERGTGTY